MRIFMFSVFIFFGVFGSHSTDARGGEIITVGSDSACDHKSITAAISNAPTAGLIEVRVAKNVVLTSLQVIDDRDVIIRGGFDNCADTTASGRTVLNGSDFSGPIFVANSHEIEGSTVSLQLEDLEITGGRSNTDGGVIGLVGAWRLFLKNVRMYDNESNFNGGAIAIENSSNLDVHDPAIFIDNNSVLTNNTADNGGAIACDGGGSIEAKNMQISLNNANANGGGVYLTNDCLFLLQNSGALQGVFLNEAQGFGGGIFATNNSLILLFSQASSEAVGSAAVYSNTAANGGGIGLTSGAQLIARNALINDNTASSTGGAIRSTGGHILIERTLPGAHCHQEIRCSQISGNQANGISAGFSGGGAIATFGGTLEVKGTYLENNHAFYGSAIRARFIDLGPSLERNVKLIGNVVAKNKGAPQVVYLDETSADIAFSTFVDNEDMDRVIEMAYPTTSASGNAVIVSGSVFDHPGTTLPSAELTTAGSPPTGDCNRNERDSSGDLAGQSRSTVALPSFEDPSIGDYRLQEDSALLDRCDNSLLGLESNVSANGFLRPVDHPFVDVFGPYDLGGIEWVDSDIIFKNGFD